MSMDVGLNSDIDVSSRQLHIQTSYLPDKKCASVTIFDGGSVVKKRHFRIIDTQSAAQVEKQVRQYHELVKTDIELLFHMAEKVHSSDHTHSILHLGQLFLDRGFYDEAVEQFEYARKVGGDKVDPDIELGKAYFNKGDYKSAYLQITAAIERYPNYPDLHMQLGKTLWRQERFAVARKQFKKAIALNENYWGAYFSLGYSLVESIMEFPVHAELAPPIERLREAELNFRKAMRLTQDLDVDTMEAGLEKLKESSALADALDLFDQARRSDGRAQLFDSEFYLKFMFGQLDDDNQTLDFYIQTIENVLAENPDYADLRHSLGVAYLLKGWQCFGKATGEFEKAVDINPSYEKAKKKLKLMQNDGRGLLILLRAILN
ncbi:tetratricopeptide repeat protein [candidate division KSB1 bacterium]|nr:tetratricopeptide repeat protein [candidate division KSB1 bacterium]